MDIIHAVRVSKKLFSHLPVQRAGFKFFSHTLISAGDFLLAACSFYNVEKAVSLAGS
jgi:hypothetical protein